MDIAGVDVEIDVIRELPELEDLVVNPSTEDQNFNSSKYGFKSVKINAIKGDKLDLDPSLEQQNVKGVFTEVNINPIKTQKISAVPTTQEQVITGLFDEVTVNAIEGQELNLNPSEEQQNFEGVFLGVNINPIQVQEITTDLDFSTSDSIELTAQEGVYIKKATINKDANLSPENIKSGVTIAGVSGDVADTSDADATSDDIVAGKTAYVANEKVQGTYVPLDTSDATATAEDIAKDKTAYVNGEKIIGTKENSEGGFSAEYQRVEYIEANGTQYIDTGVCPIANGIEAVVEFEITAVTTNTQQLIYGQWDNSTSKAYVCGIRADGYATAIYKTAEGFSYTNSEAGQTLGRNVGVSKTCPITTNYPMLLFCRQNGGNPQYVESGFFKLYSCRIYHNSKIIRDFVPCYRKEDNVIGLFDMVNNVFYINKGTGNFIKGTNV